MVERRPRWRRRLFLLAILYPVFMPARVRGAGRRAQKAELDLYCHAQNCYELLGVEPSATLAEVKRAFRRISKEHHPDSRKATARSPEIFREAANAYEVLTDDDARKNYDYYLAHPHEHASNQFRYYQYRAKVIPGGSWTILALFLFVLSAIQHLSAKTRYRMAVKYWKRMEGTLKRAKEEALARLEAMAKKKGKKHKKEDVKREMEKWMDDMVETGKLQVRGGYGKPDWRNLLCVQICLLPYTLYTWFQWRQGLGKRRADNTLTREDEIYLTYSAFGRSEDWWGALNQHEPDQAADMLAARVWEGDNLKRYMAKQESEMGGLSKAQRKQYLRYMKAQKRKKKGE